MIRATLIITAFLALMSGCTFLPTAKPAAEQSAPQESYMLPEAEQTPPMVVSEKSEPPEDIDYHNFDEDYTPNVTSAVSGQQRGFRIQVITTEDPELAGEVIEKIESTLEYAVYRIYEPPYYKVRVGNFIDRADTDEMMSELRRAGYETFIVPDIVNLDDNQQ